MKFRGRIARIENKELKKVILKSTIIEVEKTIQKRLEYIKSMLKSNAEYSIIDIFKLAKFELKHCRIDMELYNFLMEELDSLEDNNV